MAKKKKKKKSKQFVSIAWIPLLVGLIVFALDMASKYWISENIPRMTFEDQWYPYGGMGVFDDFFGIEFSIVHATNKGAAWGMFAGFQLPLLILRGCLIFFLANYMLFFNKNKALQLPVALIIAGAVGNIVDYFIYGHVVDMLNFVFWDYHYPVFNLADSAIFVGVFSIAILSWIQSKPCKRQSGFRFKFY